MPSFLTRTGRHALALASVALLVFAPPFLRARQLPRDQWGAPAVTGLRGGPKGPHYICSVL